MDRGYFPVFRRIFDSDIWGHKVARDLWIFILGNVTHYPTKLCANYGCVDLEPGQMVTGLHSLSERNGFSFQQVRTAIDYLISTNRITRSSTKRYSIITVCNWYLYRDAQLGEQQLKPQTEQQSGNNQVTIRQQTGNNIQEVKKLRSKERTKPFILPDSIRPEVWKAFEEHRVKLRKPMTDHARQLMITSCEKIGGDPNELLEHAILSGWQKVFPIKSSSSGNGCLPDIKSPNLCRFDGCNKLGIIGQGGKMYCRKHDPEAITT